MFQRREAVVEHGIVYVEIVVFQFCTAVFVVEHLEVVLALLFAQESAIEAMAIVEQIIGGHDGQGEYHEQDNGNGLVGLRLLHGTAIIAQRGISRHLLEELCVDAVVIVIELPLMEGQSGYSTLVADIEDDMEIGLKAIVEPLDFWSCERRVAIGAHEVTTSGLQTEVVVVETLATGVGKKQRTFILAVDVAEIGGVGVGAGASEWIAGVDI